jgi:hypothetical protein
MLEIAITLIVGFAIDTEFASGRSVKGAHNKRGVAPSEERAKSEEDWRKAEENNTRGRNADSRALSY